jgi:hypothetical protein
VSYSRECSPYRGLHVPCERLGVVSCSRAIFCRAVPNPTRSTRNFHHHVLAEPAQVVAGSDKPWGYAPPEALFERVVYAPR